MTIRGALGSPGDNGAVTPTYSYNFLASVFWLILTFIGSSGLFIVLGMEFLGLIFLIVYVGAICIIFLFVIMMIPGGDQKERGSFGSRPFFNYLESKRGGGRAGDPVDRDPWRLRRSGSPSAIGILIGAILAAELASAVPDSFFKNSEFEHRGPTRDPSDEALYSLSSSNGDPGGGSPLGSPGPESITSGLQNFIYTGGSNGSAPYYNDSGILWIPPGTNLEAIGSVLYINYYYAFILVSFILLVAMIGAIVLGLQSSDQN
uniref:NADH-ubiquinone oxidoreductase chain 6 n=1 Tax=Hoilungia sp. H24 TaxID=2781606 RepID=A0A7U3NFZ7_9METZ|nr:NADH dehydrogenase subunit 6 [Hoilungia sp. H24]